MEKYEYLLGKDGCIYRTKDHITYQINKGVRKGFVDYDGDDICFYKDYSKITKEEAEKKIRRKIED